MNSDTVYVGQGVDTNVFGTNVDKKGSRFHTFGFFVQDRGHLRTADFVTLEVKPGQKVIIGGYEFESEKLGKMLNDLMEEKGTDRFYSCK